MVSTCAARRAVLYARAMSLSGKQRRFLRAEAHALDALVSLGKEGMTENLLGAVQEALLAHELIKVRVLENAPLTRQEAAAALPEQVYDYIYGHYGTVGLIVAGVMVVVAIVSIFTWLDRRK